MPDCPCGLSGFFASTHLNYRAALKIKKSLHINPHRNHRHAGHCGFIENMYIARIFCRCFSYHLTSTGRYCKIWISTAKKHSATNPPQHCANGKLQWQGLMPLHRMKQRSLRLKSRRREGGTSFCWSKGVQSNRRVHAQCRQPTRVKIFLSVPAGYRCSDCSNAKIKTNRKGYSFYGSSDSDVHHRTCGYIYHFQNFQPEHQDFFSNCLSMHLSVQRCCLFLTLFLQV